MPGTERNEKVRYAVSRALKQRGLSHKDVAQLLGLAEQTVSNKISEGNFNSTQAAKWSAALGIETDVFLYGREPLPTNDYQVILESLSQMRSQIENLQKDVNSLLAWRTEANR